MSREKFIDRRFQKPTLVLIDQANAIIGEYLPRGFTLTIRQLHYQFVARGYYENVQSNYKKLVRDMTNARLAGLVDWDAIEDRTRTLQGGRGGWDGTADWFTDMSSRYAEDWWADQRFRPEVWIEKSALLGVIEGVCNRYGVRYYASRGDDAKSPSYEAGRRFRAVWDQGQIPLVLHLADHDPRGVHFTPFIRDELDMFCGNTIEVIRLGLTMAQVEEHDPPPNFVKDPEDERLGPRYIGQYGEKCWELDALSPEVIAGLIEDKLTEMIDDELWKAAQAREQRRQAMLSRIADRWDEVEKQFGS